MRGVFFNLVVVNIKSYKINLITYTYIFTMMFFSRENSSTKEQLILSECNLNKLSEERNRSIEYLQNENNKLANFLY